VEQWLKEKATYFAIWAGLTIAVLSIYPSIHSLVWNPVFQLMAGIASILFVDRYVHLTARLATLTSSPDPWVVQQQKWFSIIGGIMLIAAGINGLFFHYKLL
jgi:hypothetical protein